MPKPSSKRAPDPNPKRNPPKRSRTNARKQKPRLLGGAFLFWSDYSPCLRQFLSCHGPLQRAIQAIENSISARTRAGWVARSSRAMTSKGVHLEGLLHD